MSKFLYGIDFGTTNSALFYLWRRKKWNHSKPCVPSFCIFSGNKVQTQPLNYVVGENVPDAYLSDGMKGRFIKSIKQILSRSSFIETRIHNKRYNASGPCSFNSKDLKTKVGWNYRIRLSESSDQRDQYFLMMIVLQKILLLKPPSVKRQKCRFYWSSFSIWTYRRRICLRKQLKRKKKKVPVADLGGGQQISPTWYFGSDHSGNKDRRNVIWFASGGIYIGGDSLTPCGSGARKRSMHHQRFHPLSRYGF